MLSKNQKTIMIVVGIIILVAVIGGGIFAWKDGLFKQEDITSGCQYGTRSAAYPCTAGECPSYGKAGNCPITNVADALKRPLLSIPQSCLEGPKYHNSPTVLASQSPWVANAYGPDVPVPGCEEGPSSLNKVFDQCSKTFLNPEHPLGIDRTDCTQCAPETPEKCFMFNI